MRKSLLHVAMFVLVIGIAGIAQAQATRTWVSGVGDDANPCSRTAPCKTFAGAISKTAPGGIISVLDPGGYGGVTITKSLTIDGTAQIAGSLVTGTNAIVINAGVNDVVVLRNIEIHGVGTGLDAVRILQAKAVFVENCRIQNFSSDGIDVANTSNAIKLYVRDTDIRNNTADGIRLASVAPGTVRAEINTSNISQNGANGVHVAGSNNSATVSNSMLSGNLTGLAVEQNTSSAFIEASTVANNTDGIFAGVGGQTLTVVRISHSAVVNNSGNARTGVGTVVGFSNNMVIFNGGNANLSSSVGEQ